jgi:diadenylate cyclase
MVFSFDNFVGIAITVIDVVIMWIVIYYGIKIVRSNSRTIQIFKGIIFIMIAKSLASYFGLHTVLWMTDNFLSWGFLALIVIFQPEIRTILERLGKTNALTSFTTLTGNEREHLVGELVKAANDLSEHKIGALITVEQTNSLNDYIRTGTLLNSLVSSELLHSLFVTTSPLHDGAVIIQGNRLACASAYFPPTSLDMPSKFGARHRAAIGISEVSDSITIVISEETGNISIARNSQLIAMDIENLRDFLMQFICHMDIDNRQTIIKKRHRPVFESDEESVEVDVEQTVKPKKVRKPLFARKPKVKSTDEERND